MASTSKDITNLEENDLFYFESDHLALKGNHDYSDLLKTIAVLEAQRIQAIKDVDKIIQIQKQAVADPYVFVEKLKKKADLGIPGPQKIPEIPIINWKKYDVPIPEDAFKLIDQEIIREEATEQFKEPRKPKHKNPSATFNMPWSSDEQKKLEELLVQFPPEAVEMRRYKKIAEALGNRTVKQVMSRVQKYFLKLFNAGLPIPGRIPKTVDKKRKFSHKHQRHNSYLYKPTTFFPDMEVPVFMSENDDDLPVQNVAPTQKFPEPSVVCKVEATDEVHMKIDLLKRVKELKEVELNGERFTHVGFKCDLCDEDPIIGCRWHCFTCKEDSVDFCSDCVVAQLNAAACHPLTHSLLPLRDDQPDIKQLLSSETQLESDSTSLASVQCSESSSLDALVKSEPNSADSDSDSSNSSDSDGMTLDDLDENSEPSAIIEYDKDYTSETFNSRVGDYNYLDPNFLPE